MPSSLPRISRPSGLLLMLPFLAVYYAVLAHHVLWRDEMNAWAIACVSQSLPELLHRVHYEAHPALWYVLLYPFSRLSQAPWMLKLVQGVIGTGIYLLLALTTPFGWLELALIFAGYYISFQYTVMCRMYGLEVLFALAYVLFRMKWPERVSRNTLWLVLIANVDITAAILSTGLLLEYLLERYRTQRAEGAVRRRQFAAAVGLYAAGLAVSLGTLWPANDIGWSATGKLFSEFFSGEHIGSAFAKWGGLAFFPQSMDPVSLWFDPHPWPHGVLVPVTLVLFILVFRKHRHMGWMLLAITLMGMFFSDATGVAGIRHIGVLFLGFLMALWMLRFRGETVSRWSYALLGLLVLATAFEVKAQWMRPFADDDAAAAWLLQNRLQDLPMLGSPDTNVIGVPERLQRPLFQIECQCWDRVLTFSHRRDGFHWETDVPSAVVRGLNTIGAPQAVFLENRALTAGELEAMKQGGVTPTLLAVFDKGYVPDEHFFIYRLAR